MSGEASHERTSAILPLALFEALRQHDLPSEILQDEDITESLPRRFGLSDVVFRQIRRYEDALRRGQDVTKDEVLDLIRLVLRRPDASTVLREAGASVARRYFGRSRRFAAVRLFGHGLPRPLTYMAIRRATDRLLTRTLGHSQVRLVGRPLVARMPEPITAAAGGDGTACVMFSAVIEEMVVLYTGQRPSVLHTLCVLRGDAVCEWSVAD